MHINRKWIFLIIGVFVMFVIIVIFSPRNVNQINDDVDHIDLTIYGLKSEPVSYRIDEEKLKKPLIESINSIVILENEIAKRTQFDLPKGKSYKLNVFGSQEKEFLLINGYCVYNDMVYKVINYETVIQNITENFRVI